MKRLMLATVVLAAFVVGCGDSNKDRAHQEGYKDAEEGISAEANPYRGPSTNMARGWLDGWKQYHKEHDKPKGDKE